MSRVRFRPNELKDRVLAHVRKKPGMYAAEITSDLFGGLRTDDYYNDMCVQYSIKALEREGLVRRTATKVYTLRGLRDAKLVYPTQSETTL